MRKFEVRAFLGLILTVLLVFAPFPSGLAFADETTTLTATADARISQSRPTTNYGTQATLAASTTTSNNQRSLVKFTLPDTGATPPLPSDSSIKVSTVTMQMTTAPGSSSTQAAHRVLGSTPWTEAGVTWNTRDGSAAWSFGGGAAGTDYSTNAAASTGSGTTSNVSLSWTVLGETGGSSNIPQDWLTGAITNNGLLVKDSTEAGGGGISAVESVQGTAKNKALVSTTALTAATTSSLYLAAISLSTGTVTSVSGAGLTWSLVKSQCGGLNDQNTAVWKAVGTGTATVVTANFARANAVIHVTRFSGVDTTTPTGATASANTKAVGDTTCTGGTASTGPTVSLTTTNPNSWAFGAVSTGQQIFTVGSGFTLLLNTNGPTGTTIGLGTEYKAVATPAATTVNATLGGTVQWSIIAVEINSDPQPPPIYNSTQAASNKPTLAVRHLRNVTLSAPTAGISEITHNWTFPSGSTSGNYDGVLFSKLQGATAPSGTAADGATYTVGQTVSGSEVVTINTSAFTTLSDIDENGADSIVLPGTQYTYKSYTHDNTTITGAATAAPPHYAKGVASSSVTTTTGGGTNKNWSYKTAGSALAPPGLNPNTGVVSVSNDNKVHSMSAGTGVRNYQPSAIAGLTGAAVQSRPTIIPGTESTPSRAYDVVYVGSQDGYVYAFNAASGAQLWKSALLGSAIQGSAAVQLKKYSNGSFTPTVDLVIVGTRNTGDTVNNKIYGLNGDTGATVWTATYTSLGVTGVDIISSMPMIDYSNNTVWVTSRAGSGGGQPSIFQLNTNDGSKVRAVTLSTTVKDIDASPTLNAAGTFLYVVTGGSGAGQLVAVNTATGAAYASVAVSGSLGGAGYPIPVANGGSDDVYFVTSGASGGVYARSFDRTSSFGTTLTWDRTDLSSVSTPVFMPPPGTLYLYVGDGAGVLHKLNPATGLDAATRTVASTTLGDPGMDLIANKLYVGGSNGRIYSFDLF